MYNTKKFKPLTKENILLEIDEYSLFRYYIHSFKAINKPFCSELRKDSTPSCVITDKFGTLIYKDFGTGAAMDAFSYIQNKYHLNFLECLSVINTDFNLKLGNFSSSKLPTMNYFGLPEKSINRIEQKDTKISIKARDWNNNDTYWKDYYITTEDLNHFNVKPLSNYWINDNLVYSYNPKDPAYSYEEFNGLRKILRPYNKEYKWRSNIPGNILSGLRQLPDKGDILIITKSLKDVIILYKLNIPAVSPQSESILINQESINYLFTRFTTIYSLMDYDTSGIHLAWQMRKLYNIKPLFLTDKLWNRKGGYLGCKDISDLVKLKGLDWIKNNLTLCL